MGKEIIWRPLWDLGSLLQKVALKGKLVGNHFEFLHVCCLGLLLGGLCIVHGTVAQTVVPIILRTGAQMRQLVEESSDYLSCHSY